MSLIRLSGTIIVVILAMLSGPADATSPVTVHGFGTLGLVYNATDKAQFIRDLSQPHGVSGWGAKTDSLAGLQINYRPPGDKFEAVVQAVSRYDYGADYHPRITWAFVKYSPTPDIDLRAGRLGWDVYMLADSRSVGYSYTWVRPPMEYFGALQLSHIDGADVVVRHAFGNTLAWVKLYAGRARERIPITSSVVYDLTGTEVYGGHVDVQIHRWQLRLSASSYRPKRKAPAPLDALYNQLRATGDPAAYKLAEDLSLAGKDIRQYSLGVVYERGPFQSEWMYDYTNSNTRLLSDHQSALWLVSYRVGRWTPYAFASGTWLHNFDGHSGLSPTNPLYAAANQVIRLSRFEQHSLSLGVRFDFMTEADLKLQIDNITTRHSPSFWRRVKPGWDGNTVVFSAVVDFVF